MSERPPTGLGLLWSVGKVAERKPRLGLSLERVVQSGIELADHEGIEAVSMKRVAERLGFTTMSLYRYVASKDDLLLLMQDAIWQPPLGLDVRLDDWRSSLERWTRAQHVIMQGHTWLQGVRHIERAGTPSHLAWMDLGLQALFDTSLSVPERLAVLLVFSGYVFSQGLVAGAVAEGARKGLFEPEQATQAFGELIRANVDSDRFPALHEAIEEGALTSSVVHDDRLMDFDFGLGILLDGVERLMERQASS